MTDPDELRITLVAIADALDSLSVKWAIGGSIASAAYGEPRSTNDVDVIATLSEGQARAFIEALGATYYGDVDMALDAVRRKSSFNVIDNRTFIKVDVFVPAQGPMGTGQLDRRRDLEILRGARALPILGPEDAVLQKLRWYREGGEVSDRQWRDIQSVLRATRTTMDAEYLERVGGEAGLQPLLARALAELE